MRLNIWGFWFFVGLIAVSIIFWIEPKMFNRLFAYIESAENKVEKLVNNNFIDVDNKICPVYKGKEPVDKRYFSIYEGKKYHFCCEDCVKLFEKKPDFYILKLTEKESILKTP